MKYPIWDVDGIREATAEEVAAIEESAARYEAEERHRPLSEAEVVSLLLRQKVNELEVDDQVAVRMTEFYPAWRDNIGKAVDAGWKFQYGGKLYKVLQAHTLAESWVPGEGTESLYSRIDAVHTGDKYDPIPYDGNMELEEGKYYSQNGVTYRCIRATGQPVYHALADLVGLYVEVVTT